MGVQVTRREFVKLSAGAGAALGVGRALAGEAPPRPGWRGSQRVEQIATNCEMCFWRCGILAEVADGKVVRITGNPDHPLTHGRLCGRGNAGTELLYDPDRLKYPLLRTGKRGEGSSSASLGSARSIISRSVSQNSRRSTGRRVSRSSRTASRRHSSAL